MKQYGGLLITIVIVLLLGAFLFFAPEKPLPYAPVDVGGGSIDVQDQGNLDYATLAAELAAPGFITIHQALGEAPGPVVGVSDYLEVGVYDEINIQIPEAMTPGLTYITLLHADDGDSIFDIQKDMPVMVDEEVVRPSFDVIADY